MGTLAVGRIDQAAPSLPSATEPGAALAPRGLGAVLG